MSIERPDTIRHRSPTFPSYSLEQAVNSIRKAYEKDRRSATTREVAATHMGYTASSGSGSRMLASVSNFGLIEDAGHGKIRVTELAESILHPRSERERFVMLNTAIKSPKIFGLLIAEHGLENMPSPENLKAKLIRDYNFNGLAADGLLRSLRQSIAYVKSFNAQDLLLDHDSTATEALNKIDESQVEKADEQVRHPSAKHQASQVVLADHQIDGPLSARTRVELSIYGPLGVEEATRLKLWLEKIVQPWAEFRIVEAKEEDVAQA